MNNSVSQFVEVLKDIETNRSPVMIEEALAFGSTTYNPGEPCANGHISNRYVKGNLCVQCVKESNAVRKANGKALKSVKRFQEVNPDYMAAMAGWGIAKRRGAYRPEDFRTVGDLMFATQGFYTEARRLTIETGIPHEVDHRIPLRRGGSHHPSNLRVTTSAFNRSKKDMLDIEVLAAMLNGTWKGPQDAETVKLVVDEVQWISMTTGDVISMISK